VLQFAQFGIDMDDYRDLVTAAFGLLCAALMLIAGLLFIVREPGHADPVTEIELQVSDNLARSRTGPKDVAPFRADQTTRKN
jgi:hypothetical protein